MSSIGIERKTALYSFDTENKTIVEMTTSFTLVYNVFLQLIREVDEIKMSLSLGTNETRGQIELKTGAE